MKILAVSDVEESKYWEHWAPGRLEGVDLILSAGDLKSSYLEFLVTMTNKHLLYVRGNHDTIYDIFPPLGCIDIDDCIYNVNGVRILGLGGSIRYREGKDMYSEAEMSRRIKRLRFKLARFGGFDILLTHAPCRYYGDLDTTAHRGFECFNELLNKYRPAYHIYGHVHKEYGHFERIIGHPSGTSLINACRSYIFDI